MAKKVLLDAISLQKILPHRYPFLLLDYVESISFSKEDEIAEGTYGVAFKNVTVNEPFFQGHFPSLPIMPGVLILEAMGQLGPVIFGYFHYLKKRKWEPVNVLAASISKVKFRQPVVPGDQLRIESRVLRSKSPMFLLGGKTFVEDALVAEAEILAKVS